MDIDFHTIKNELGEQINTLAPIVIGNSVQTGCRWLILKGAMIPDYSTIGANSVVGKKLDQKNDLCVGKHVVKVKENITWEL